MVAGGELRLASFCLRSKGPEKRISALSLNQFHRRGRAKLRLSRGFTLGLAQQHHPTNFGLWLISCLGLWV